MIMFKFGGNVQSRPYIFVVRVLRSKALKYFNKYSLNNYKWEEIIMTNVLIEDLKWRSYLSTN